MLRQKMGTSCYEELVVKREKPKAKATNPGPRFWAHPTVKAVHGRCGVRRRGLRTPRCCCTQTRRSTTIVF